MPFDIDTELKQLDVSLKHVRKIKNELPKLTRENVEQYLKIFKIDLQLLRQDLQFMKQKQEKDGQ